MFVCLSRPIFQLHGIWVYIRSKPVAVTTESTAASLVENTPTFILGPSPINTPEAVFPAMMFRRFPQNLVVPSEAPPIKVVYESTVMKWVSQVAPTAAAPVAGSKTMKQLRLTILAIGNG